MRAKTLRAKSFGANAPPPQLFSAAQPLNFV
jgi:hypothetical protein